MGLLTAPFWGLLRVFQEVADQADAEMYDEDAVKAELTELYLRLEAGSMTEHDFDLRETELVTRLGEIDEHREQQVRRGSR